MDEQTVLKYRHNELEARVYRIERGVFSAVFRLFDSGIPQAERHPAAVGGSVGLYSLTALFALVVALKVLFTLTRAGTAVLSIAAILLILETLGSWFLHGMLFHTQAFSPATFSFTIAAVFSLLATLLRRYILDV